LENFGGRDYLYYPIKKAPPLRQGGRLLSLLDDCVEEALLASSLSAEQLQDAGLFLGSSSFEIGDEELRLQRELKSDASASSIPRSLCGDLAQHLAQRFSIRGGTHTFNTACTSSANALLYALHAVRSGKLAAALVVGVECFNLTTLAGFDSLQLLSRDRYRPFDFNRSGLVLGEGMGAVVVTSAGQVSPDVEWGDVVFLGGSSGCDPKGMTCSSAESMAQVMDGALKSAGIGSDDVALIKAHATGSESNDAAEVAAMRIQFKQRVPDFTSIKGALGHTLGASGVVELIALLSCLRSGQIPSTLGFSVEDEQLGLSPLRESRAFAGGPVMFNSFGFGGNNNSLILELES
jgi:3-oxoacyl-[acyl-carrier-protein] synthase-1